MKKSVEVLFGGPREALAFWGKGAATERNKMGPPKGVSLLGKRSGNGAHEKIGLYDRFLNTATFAATMWWRWRESNSRPKAFPRDFLRAQSMIWCFASLVAHQQATRLAISLFPVSTENSSRVFPYSRRWYHSLRVSCGQRAVQN